MVTKSHVVSHETISSDKDVRGDREAVDNTSSGHGVNSCDRNLPLVTRYLLT